MVERRRILLAAVAVLTVLGLGLTAPAVDSVQSGDGGAQGATAEASSGDTPGDGPLLTAIVLLLVLAVVASVGYTLYQESIPKGLTLVFVGTILLLAAIVGAVHVLPGASSDGAAGVSPDNASTAPADGATPTPTVARSSDAGGPQQGSPTGTLAVLLAILAIGALVVVRYSGSVDEQAPDSQSDDERAAVAAAAGRAADELEATDLSNAVYRAWSEMTEALDVADPETTTPAQFRDLAVEAGFDEADVETLTDLFREVRYGDAPATARREQRARETLRRIEATGTAGDADEGTTPSGGDDA